MSVPTSPTYIRRSSLPSSSSTTSAFHPRMQPIASSSRTSIRSSSPTTPSTSYSYDLSTAPTTPSLDPRQVGTIPGWRPTSNVPDRLQRRHRTTQGGEERNRWLSEDEGQGGNDGLVKSIVGRRRRRRGSSGSSPTSSTIGRKGSIKSEPRLDHRSHQPTIASGSGPFDEPPKIKDIVPPPNSSARKVIGLGLSTSSGVGGKFEMGIGSGIRSSSVDRVVDSNTKSIPESTEVNKQLSERRSMLNKIEKITCW